MLQRHNPLTRLIILSLSCFSVRIGEKLPIGTLGVLL